MSWLWRAPLMLASAILSLLVPGPVASLIVFIVASAVGFIPIALARYFEASTLVTILAGLFAPLLVYLVFRLRPGREALELTAD